MSKPSGIILLGANGADKSTLGRELASVLNFAHFDVEDFNGLVCFIKMLDGQ